VDFFPTPGPHWLGLVAALGVLLALALWWVVTDERWSVARPVVTVTGAVLLLVPTGLIVRGVATLAYLVVDRGPFYRDAPHRWEHLGLAVAGVVAGLFVATYGAADDDRPTEAAPAAEPVAIPARAWSPTEVLGDAPVGAPGEEAYEEPPVPRAGAIAARVLDRGVIVPLLAVAVGLALPTSQVLAGIGQFGSPAEANADRVLKALLAGVIVGLGLLGAALALDVWERRLAVAAFALAAVGEGLAVAAPSFLGNEYWTALAVGLSAGLLAPAALRVLHRPLWRGRWPLLVGVAAAMLLLGANDVLGARAQRVENVGGDLSGDLGGDVVP
jgi:hypothetical protein